MLDAVEFSDLVIALFALRAVMLLIEPMVVTIINLVAVESVLVLRFQRVLQKLQLLMVVRILQIVIVALRKVVVSLRPSHVVD